MTMVEFPLPSSYQQQIEEWVCTQPEKQAYMPGRGRFHPAPWELAVQSLIRTTRISKVARTPHEMLVGLVTEGQLLAVAYIDYSSSRKAFHIAYLSVRIDHQGYGLSQHLLAACVSAVQSTYFSDIVTQNNNTIRLYCEVDSRNKASISALHAFGFSLAGSVATSREEIQTFIYQAPFSGQI